MGEAKRRGSFEERRAQAIAAGRVKRSRSGASEVREDYSGGLLAALGAVLLSGVSAGRRGPSWLDRR